VDLTGVTIEDINSDVAANGEWTNARFMTMSMRKPYDNGAGVDIVESFTLEDATISDYSSAGRVFTIEYDSGGTQSSPTTTNIKLIDSTFTNVELLANTNGSNDEGGILYGDIREQKVEMTNLVFNNVEAPEIGGAFYFRNAKEFVLENVDATNFFASEKGSFFYHDNTYAYSWDLTMSIKNGAYNCDSTTAFVWDTVKAEVIARTQTRGSVFEIYDAFGNDIAITL
jgi:hypothetical protein